MDNNNDHNDHNNNLNKDFWQRVYKPIELHTDTVHDLEYIVSLWF